MDFTHYYHPISPQLKILYETLLWFCCVSLCDVCCMACFCANFGVICEMDFVLNYHVFPHNGVVSTLPFTVYTFY